LVTGQLARRQQELWGSRCLLAAYLPRPKALGISRRQRAHQSQQARCTPVGAVLLARWRSCRL